MIVHTQKSLVCLSSVNEPWESNKLILGKKTNIGGSLDVCHFYGQSVGNGQVSSVCTSVTVRQRGRCPEVANVCEL
jgi:hypothetical protein